MTPVSGGLPEMEAFEFKGCGKGGCAHGGDRHAAGIYSPETPAHQRFCGFGEDVSVGAAVSASAGAGAGGGGDRGDDVYAQGGGGVL